MSLYYNLVRECLNQQYNAGIHKNVRSKDQVDIGNVISESGDTFTVMQGVKKEYNISKSAVEAFDGSELYLSIPFSMVLRYKVE